MKITEVALTVFAGSLLVQACAPDPEAPVDPTPEDGAGGAERPVEEWTCADDPACDPPFDEGPECDVSVMRIPLMGGYGGILNQLGGAGGHVVCLEPVR